MLAKIRAETLGLLAKAWDRLPKSWRRRVLFAVNDHFMIGVVGLVTDAQRRVLLLEHRFRTPWRWGLPGGFMSRGESVVEALARELKEEVALDVVIQPEPFDCEMNTEAGYLSMTLIARAIDPPPILQIQTDEILNGGFYAVDDLPEGLYPHHKALVLKYLSN